MGSKSTSFSQKSTGAGIPDRAIAKVFGLLAFDRGGRIAQLIEAAGCHLVYLPPYSPDLNRSENFWATLKSRVRKLLLQSDNLRDAMETVLKQAAS